MTLMRFEDPSCVFIRVRKTGSTSIVRGLLGGVGNTAEMVTGAPFPPQWDGLFTFAFVRNPFERLVSCLAMFRSHPVETEAEADLRKRLDLHTLLDVVEDDAIDFTGPDYRSKMRLHALPMSHPSYHLDRADFVGRFESFDDDYLRVAARLGRSGAEVPHHRQGPAERDYRPQFDAALRGRAEEVFAEDLQRFGYSFG